MSETQYKTQQVLSSCWG